MVGGQQTFSSGDDGVHLLDDWADFLGDLSVWSDLLVDVLNDGLVDVVVQSGWFVSAGVSDLDGLASLVLLGNQNIGALGLEVQVDWNIAWLNVDGLWDGLNLVRGNGSVFNGVVNGLHGSWDNFLAGVAVEVRQQLVSVSETLLLANGVLGNVLSVVETAGQTSRHTGQSRGNTNDANLLHSNVLETTRDQTDGLSCWNSLNQSNVLGIAGTVAVNLSARVVAGTIAGSQKGTRGLVFGDLA